MLLPKEQINFYDLGKEGCKKKRSIPVLSSGISDEVLKNKNKFIVKQIKDSIANGYDPEDIEDALFKAFKEFPFDNDEQRKIHTNDALRMIFRYLTSEDRTAKIATPKTVSPFGICDVEVFPHFVFRGVKEFEIEMDNGKKKKDKIKIMLPYIEVVKISCGKPKITQNGKKKNASVNAYMPLYALLLYAREMMTKEDKQTPIMVMSSIYYLRKNGDSNDPDHPRFDADFFSDKDAGNIVTLCELHSPLDYSGPKKVDETFRPQFKEFIEGTDSCEKSTCEFCEYKEVCNFSRAPLVVKLPRKQASVKSLRLTDSQEDVIGFLTNIANRKKKKDGEFAVVNAGAGSGKTTVIALSIAYMIEAGVDPADILLITYTVTGANEMRERIKMFLEDLECEENIDDLTICTFHAFGNEIIQEKYRFFGFNEIPSLINDVERLAIIRDILRDNLPVQGLDYRDFRCNMKLKKGALHAAAEIFNIIKKNRYSYNDIDAIYDSVKIPGVHMGKDGIKSILALYDLYNDELLNQNKIEFSDMELLLEDLVRQDPYFYERERSYKFIIVDEFQDSNRFQMDLIKQLVDTKSFEAFLAVGDDSQSIFSFRDTTPEFIIHLEDHLGKNVQKFFLLENHRSTPEIIEFANKINALNVDRVAKDLVATREHGEPVTVRAFWKKEDENNFVIQEIKKHHNLRKPYEDMAYIASTKTELMKMASDCTEAGIPTVLLNPEPLMENSRVIAALALFSFIKDQSATKNALIYLNAVSKNTLVCHSHDEILEEIAYLQNRIEDMYSMNEENKLQNLRDLLNELDDDDEIYDRFKEDLLSRYSFSSVVDYAMLFKDFGEGEAIRRESSYPGVVLTTAHSSKGMEWPIVFNSITKYHSRPSDFNNAKIREEKRRLFFVSSTRARDKLYVIGQAVAYGPKNDRTYNAFLIEAYQALSQVFTTNNPYDIVGKKNKKQEKQSNSNLIALPEDHLFERRIAVKDLETYPMF